MMNNNGQFIAVANTKCSRQIFFAWTISFLHSILKSLRQTNRFKIDRTLL